MSVEAPLRPRKNQAGVINQSEIQSFILSKFNTKGQLYYLYHVEDQFDAHPWRAEDPEYLRFYKRILLQGMENTCPSFDGHYSRYNSSPVNILYKLDFMHTRHLLELSSKLGQTNIAIDLQRQEMLDEGYSLEDTLSRFAKSERGQVPDLHKCPQARSTKKDELPIVVPVTRFNRLMAGLGITRNGERIPLNQYTVEKFSNDEMNMIAKEASGPDGFGSYGISVPRLLAKEIQYSV